MERLGTLWAMDFHKDSPLADIMALKARERSITKNAGLMQLFFGKSFDQLCRHSAFVGVGNKIGDNL